VDYRVEALGPVEDGAYAWTAVTGGDREIDWILARDPDLGDEARAETDTDQPPRNDDPADG
jgi:lipocalin